MNARILVQHWRNNQQTEEMFEEFIDFIETNGQLGQDTPDEEQVKSIRRMINLFLESDMDKIKESEAQMLMDWQQAVNPPDEEPAQQKPEEVGMFYRFNFVNGKAVVKKGRKIIARVYRRPSAALQGRYSLEIPHIGQRECESLQEVEHYISKYCEE